MSKYKLTTCAKIASTAVCLINVDLPPMFGPVTSTNGFVCHDSVDDYNGKLVKLVKNEVQFT